MAAERTALVTGGAGFIGSHLCDKLLASGWKVRVLDDLSVGRTENLPDGVDLIEGDVCDPRFTQRACQSIDTVFHLAARVSIRESVERFVDDARVNLMGTLCVLSSAGAAGVRRFVHASTMGVYADSPKRTLVCEHHPTEPLSPYGLSKLSAENYVFLMAKGLGIEPVVLRLFNTYGTRQAYSPYVGVITIFVSRILSGQPCVIFGDGEQCRDFVNVDDVTQAFVKAADSPSAVGNVFNIGTGVGTTVNELAELIRAKLSGGDFRHEATQGVELCYSVPDISKARDMLGYWPKHRLENRVGDVIECIRGL